jgi:ankyrin repeat protein
LEEVLQSTSDCLYPAEMGKRTVNLASTDCDGDTALHVLIWRSDTSGALLLIESGANVNAVGDMGETPLHVAIRKENQALVRALIAAGAETDIVSEFGSTARALAAEKGIALSRTA